MVLKKVKENSKMIAEIKSWKEMEEEFGLTRAGDINCFPIFLKSMEQRIPEDRLIEVNGGKWNDNGLYIASEIIKKPKMKKIRDV